MSSFPVTEVNRKTIANLNNSEEETVYLLFSRDSCPICNKLKPALTEYLKDHGQSVYLYNTDKNRNESNFEDI